MNKADKLGEYISKLEDENLKHFDGYLKLSYSEQIILYGILSSNLKLFIEQNYPENGIKMIKGIIKKMSEM